MPSPNPAPARETEELRERLAPLLSGQGNTFLAAQRQAGSCISLAWQWWWWCEPSSRAKMLRVATAMTLGIPKQGTRRLGTCLPAAAPPNYYQPLLCFIVAFNCVHRFGNRRRFQIKATQETCSPYLTQLHKVVETHPGYPF